MSDEPPDHASLRELFEMFKKQTTKLPSIKATQDWVQAHQTLLGSVGQAICRELELPASESRLGTSGARLGILYVMNEVFKVGCQTSSTSPAHLHLPNKTGPRTNSHSLARPRRRPRAPGSRCVSASCRSVLPVARAGGRASAKRPPIIAQAILRLQLSARDNHRVEKARA